MIRFPRAYVSVSLLVVGASVLVTGVVRSAPGQRSSRDLGAGSRPLGVAGGAGPSACSIDVASGWSDCGRGIDARQLAEHEWVLAVDMGADRYRRLDVFAEICHPRDWVLHVADSPTANGLGGDASTTDHDAEAYLYNGSDFGFDSTGDFSRHEHPTRMRLPRVLAGSRIGCRVVHAAAIHAPGDKLSRFDLAAASGSPIRIGSLHGLKLGYQPCASATDPDRSVGCDWEDPAGTDQYKWYVGINRTVGSAARNGRGVRRACVVRGPDPDRIPDSCL